MALSCRKKIPYLILQYNIFRTENKLKQHKIVCKNYEYCYLEMPREEKSIYKNNHGGKYMKIPFII